MNDYVQANKESWATLAKDHYEAFKARLSQHDSILNDTPRAELGNIAGKRLIHLQCNTGADSISLARMGAAVTGVDLVPENIYYAKKLATELSVASARFIEANVLDLLNLHDETYDIVYTTEGVLCWLPDLNLWARNVRHLLAENGFLYLLDSHPFFMTWDADELPELVVKYPYFQKQADREEWIGGYASERKQATNYSWMYTIGDIINALSKAGLHVEWFHEYDWLFFELDADEQVLDEKGNWIFPAHKGKLPYSFSLKATVR